MTYYEIIYKTSEGVSKKTQRVQAPPFQLEVANGDNPTAAGMPTREVQLHTIQGLLAVRVVPQRTDGTRGAPSPWLPVGQAYP